MQTNWDVYLNAPENIILLSYTLLQLLAAVYPCIQALLSGKVGHLVQR